MAETSTTEAKTRNTREEGRGLADRHTTVVVRVIAEGVAAPADIIASTTTTTIVVVVGTGDITGEIAYSYQIELLKG